MRYSSKLAIYGVVAGLSAAHVVIADEAAPEICICEEAPATEDPSGEVVGEPAVEEEVIDEKVADETTTDEEATEEVTVTEEDGEVPLDWVKRGGDEENPDVIFYNMAGGGTGGAPAASVNPGDAGKDGAPTTVEAKSVAPVAPIAKEKRGPIALVKGDRVFLRR